MYILLIHYEKKWCTSIEDNIVTTYGNSHHRLRELIKTQSVVELPNHVTKMFEVMIILLLKLWRFVWTKWGTSNHCGIQNKYNAGNGLELPQLESRLSFFQRLFPSTVHFSFYIIITIIYLTYDVGWIPLCQIQRWFKAVFSGSITLGNLYMPAANHNWLPLTSNNILYNA